MKYFFRFFIFIFFVINTHTVFAAPPNPAKAKISTTFTTVCLNQTAYVTFSLTNGDQPTLPVTYTYNINGGSSLTITSPNDTDVVTVNVNTSSPGSYTYTLIGAVDSLNNTIDLSGPPTPPFPSVSIVVSPFNASTITGNLSICDVSNGSGNTSLLVGSGTPANPTAWTSSSNNVATVNNSGLVTGATGAGSQTGNTTITYTNSDGCKTSVLFTVNPLPTITPNTNTVCAGSTINLNGSGTPATSGAWTSSSNLIATVDNTGLVTGVALGSVTITYKDSNGCTATRNITVNGSAADFTYTNGALCSGSSVTFSTTSTGNSYTWNFGDGATSSLQ
ncbi:MAG: hypothetical protein EBS55_10360, partial [Flavobacteriaceae bacterium]|nr:hypothetical protein [Flavobacteriaceae bacterium]